MSRKPSGKPRPIIPIVKPGGEVSTVPDYFGLAVKVIQNEKEPWKVRNAFETYVYLGPDRSLGYLAEITNIPYRSLLRYSMQYHWAARSKIIDESVLSRLAKGNIKKYQEAVMRKHLAMYRKAQNKSMEFIDKPRSTFENSRDAIMSMDIAVKGEREVLGLNSSRIKGAIVREGFAALLEIAKGAVEQEKTNE